MRKRKIPGFLLTLIGIYVLIDAFIPINVKRYKKPDGEFSELTAYLINPPEHIKRGGKSSSEFLRLQLDGFGGAFFDNGKEFLDATEWEAVLNEIAYHDTITIKV